MERQQFLTNRLNEAARAYYQEDREIMTNKEYDTLYDELAGLEKKNGVSSFWQSSNVCRIYSC